MLSSDTNLNIIRYAVFCSLDVIDRNVYIFFREIDDQNFSDICVWYKLYHGSLGTDQ